MHIPKTAMNRVAPKIPIITGPTASGKTQAVIALAQRWPLVVVSADSRQIYRQCNIGTAKPSKEQQNTVRHRLIDILDPNETYSAAMFRDDAERAILEAFESGQLPIVVGGTGFYISALMGRLNEIPEVPADVREKVQNEVTQLGRISAHSRLTQIDPEAADNINPSDSQRISRALSVYKHTGKPISWFWSRPNQPQRFATSVWALDLPTETLNQRIAGRVESMIDEGLAQEVAGLIADGYSWDDPGLSAVGYREFREHFENEADISSVVSQIAANTRRYAKRQRTWLRREEDVIWTKPDLLADSPELTDLLDSGAGAASQLT